MKKRLDARADRRYLKDVHTTKERLEMSASKEIVRVTTEMVENEIDSVHFFTAAQGILGEVVAVNYPLHMDDTETIEEAVVKKSECSARLDMLTICVVVTKNGFTFIGTSCPVDPSAFDAKVGERIARERAVEQIWPHIGFRLRDKMIG